MTGWGGAVSETLTSNQDEASLLLLLFPCHPLGLASHSHPSNILGVPAVINDFSPAKHMSANTGTTNPHSSITIPAILITTLELLKPNVSDTHAHILCKVDRTKRTHELNRQPAKLSLGLKLHPTKENQNLLVEMPEHDNQDIKIRSNE